jgi:hypothetical protein
LSQHFRNTHFPARLKIDNQEKVFYYSRELLSGGVAERLKAAVSKTV